MEHVEIVSEETVADPSDPRWVPPEGNRVEVPDPGPLVVGEG
ncbi:hypothetical protein [Nocardiopsis synnemataformans]